MVTFKLEIKGSIKLGKLSPYLYIAPALIFSAVFLYYSIGFTIYTSFHEWNGLTMDQKFVGIRNYVDLFTDDRLFSALWHNLIFMACVIFVQIFGGLLLAVLLKAKLTGHGFFKSLLFFPNILAPIVVAAVFRIMLDPNMGSINKFFVAVNLDVLAVPWLGDPFFALLSIIIVNIFSFLGFAVVLYASGLLAIPEEMYESAKIDGSGFWNTFFKITFPMSHGTTTTMLVLGITGGLKAFDVISLLTGGGPGYSTEVLNTYLYKRLFNDFNGGLSAATGVFILTISVAMSIIQIKIYDRSQRDI